MKIICLKEKFVAKTSQSTWKSSHMEMFTNHGRVFSKYLCEIASRKHGQITSLSISTSSSCKRLFRSPIKYEKRTLKKLDENEEKVESICNVQSDDDIDVLLERTALRPGSGHQVLVIQPYIKMGPLRKRNTTPQLQLLEAVTLIKTLRQWKVVDEMIVPLVTFNKKYFFGKGNLEMLKEKIEGNPKISAVFISVNTLRLGQQLALQSVFGIPIYDRYTIVIHIFREHAKTKEAKLQIKLAELPYLWGIMRGMNFGVGEKFGGMGSYIGGSKTMYWGDRKEIFKLREAKLKNEISQLREQRQIARKERDKSNLPVVAVVGYTNAGKTSLVKALTGKMTLEPQDYLFATLDVTSHIGQLPSGLKLFYIDTLGFISDIPTYLIESFVSTLEDAVLADIIIHVRDVSHPDTVAQNENVVQTLKSLNLSETTLSNIITVGNKIDLLDKSDLKDFENKGMIFVSCTNLIGIDFLRQELEKKILLLTDQKRMVIRVESGGEEYQWIHSNSTVVEETPDSNNTQFIFMNIIISSAALAKFKHKFITSYKGK